jgi:hypothetical protein
MSLKTIILSRIKKPKEDKETARKREICRTCEYNSKNIEKIPLKKLLIKKLSDFYSYIMGRADEDNLGNCSLCGCSTFYSTIYEDENHCPEGKWKKNKLNIKW